MQTKTKTRARNRRANLTDALALAGAVALLWSALFAGMLAPFVGAFCASCNAADAAALETGAVLFVTFAAALAAFMRLR